MSYEIKGKIHFIGESKDVGKKSTFIVRDMVLEVPGVYTQFVPITFKSDYSDLLDNVSAGDVVTVLFNVEGREWQGRYFVTLSGWKIVKSDEAVGEPSFEDFPPNDDPTADPFANPDERLKDFPEYREKETPMELDDDLPF